MIVCHRCGKENQDHYKFCLGCGAELSSSAPAKAQESEVGMMKTVLADPAKSAPKSSSPKLPGTTPAPDNAVRAPSHIPEEKTNVGSPPGMSPSSSVGTYNAPPIIQPQSSATPAPAGPAPAASGPAAPVPAASGQPTSGPAAASAVRTCPQCSSEVPPAFKFCGVCGSRLPEDSAPVPAPAPVETAAAPSIVMTLIRPDGSEGGSHELHDGDNMIGRNHGEIFENDGYLSPTHAKLTVDAAARSATIKDMDSLNGVFVKMTGEEGIAAGQIIRIGQELLRFDTIERPQPTEDGTEVMGSPNPGYWGKLTVVIGKEVDGSSYPLLGDSVTLGRERGEINFPDDGYVSGLHARLSIQGDKIKLADLGSSNGTFIKINQERELANNAFVLLGQQLFRLTFS